MEAEKDDDFFPLELIVNRRLKDLEEYVEELKDEIKNKPDEEYHHGKIHDARVLITEYKYIVRNKKEILKRCK